MEPKSLVEKFLDHLQERGLGIKCVDEQLSITRLRSNAEISKDIINACKKFKPDLLKHFAPNANRQLEDRCSKCKRVVFEAILDGGGCSDSYCPFIKRR
jgi:hypothetical protein